METLQRLGIRTGTPFPRRIGRLFVNYLIRRKDEIVDSNLYGSAISEADVNIVPRRFSDQRKYLLFISFDVGHVRQRITQPLHLLLMAILLPPPRRPRDLMPLLIQPL